MSWVYGRPPVNGAQEIDFAERVRNGIDTAGQRRQLTLCGVGNMSPGDWTLYLVRKTFNDVNPPNDLPARILAWTVQAGTDKGRDDVLGLSLGTESANGDTRVMHNLLRGLALHVAAGALDVSIAWEVGLRAVDDSLVAWVAPGRPSRSFVPAEALTQLNTAPVQRMRVPTFAARVRIEMHPQPVGIVAPQLVWWAGDLAFRLVTLPVPTTLSVSSEWTVPQDATHWSVVDLGVGAAEAFVDVQFEVVQ